MVANLRFAPGVDSKECVEKLRKLAARYDIEAQVMKNRDHTPVVDIESPDFKNYAETDKKGLPDTDAAP